MEQTISQIPQQPSTPQPESSYNYANFLTRFLAYCVDGVVLYIISIVIQYSIGNDPFAAFTAQTYEEFEKLTETDPINSVGMILIAALYTLLFWVYYDGATPGKKLLGIKIIKDTGSKVTFPVAIIRYLSQYVSGFVFGLGYLWIIWDSKKQGWHDKLASTYVVRTDKKPNYLLALLITFLSIAYFAFMVWFVFSKGFYEDAGASSERQNKATQQYMESTTESMDPQAKVHFDRSQELFDQMREAGDNVDEVTRLNDENIAELKKAAEIDPNNARIWNELGAAYTWVSSTGSLEDSLAAYKKTEELEPENVVYINGVGDAYIRLERYEDAVLQFQKTLRLTDKSGYANLSLGIAYANLGIKDQAIEHYEKAVEIFMAQNDDGRFDDDILKARQGIAEVNQKL